LSEFQDIKRRAFLVFNNGNNFEETTLYNEIVTLFNKTEKVYFDGTHSTLESLSFYERIWNKSNQSMENFNRSKNRKAHEAAKNTDSQSKNVNTWVKMSKNLEKLAIIRKHEIDNNLYLPRKSQALHDQVYLNILHHSGVIDSEQYFKGMINLMGTKPKSLAEVESIIGLDVSYNI